MQGLDNSIYINRELSWLSFNERVLSESEDANIPLLERLKFVSIFGSNLDEFYMVRVGSLYDQSIFDKNLRDTKSNMTATEQLDAVFKNTPRLLARKDKAFFKIIAELKAKNIKMIAPQNLNEKEADALKKYFRDDLLPLTSPQILDKHHPFPFLNNKETYIAIHMQSKSGVMKFGIIPIGQPFERIHYINTQNGIRFMLIEDIIYHFAQDVFTKYNVIDKAIFRVTRNADISPNEALYEQDIDFRDVMVDLLRERRKLACVRLQINKAVNSQMMQYFCKKLEITKKQVFIEQSPFDVSFAFVLAERFGKSNKELINDVLSPVYPVNISHDIPIAIQAKERDLLLAYPYNSIRPFIRMLEEAAEDPNVLSIKITLYRVARNSQILAALMRAAENGKDVLSVVELRARFDEENNIGWSKQLEKSGCRITYGLDEFKVHSKLLLITKKVDGKLEYLTQIGTGNYNEKTAEQYTDLSIITTNQEIAEDAITIFNDLSIGEHSDNTALLLVSPNNLKAPILGLIDNEIEFARAEQPALITIKCNSITDKDVIDKLITASMAGVKIKLFVRGICCFRAGVPGYTENIVIKSVIGRYLEHSRIYVFGTGDRQKIYISSADFMTRNTERRVEVAAPVLDARIAERIKGMLEVLELDNVKTHIMQQNGNYIKPKISENDKRFDSQRYLFQMLKTEPPDPTISHQPNRYLTYFEKTKRFFLNWFQEHDIYK